MADGGQQDSGPMGGFESSSASVKKYRVLLLSKKYSVMVFDAKSEALISQRIAHNPMRKGTRFIYINKLIITISII